VTGDWDGDGVTDVGVYDAATGTFSLRTVSADGAVSIAPVVLGGTGDLPVTGDWDGDGIDDVGVWTPATATYTLRITPPAAPAAPTDASSPADPATAPAPETRSVVFGIPR
jgi:hypothetical protein